MRTRLALDDDLLAEAQRLTGTMAKTGLVRRALRALIDRRGARSLARLGASEPGVGEIPGGGDPSRHVGLDRPSPPGVPSTGPTPRLGFRPRHPSVLGELALGRLSQRREILSLLGSRRQAVVATHAEGVEFVERNTLHGRGIGYVDAQLLGATRLTADARLWTGDKRLAAAASGLELLVHQRTL